jgi:FMN-dependent NADH-azoreductase
MNNILLEDNYNIPKYFKTFLVFIFVLGVNFIYSETRPHKMYSRTNHQIYVITKTKEVIWYNTSSKYRT